jgi:hypothetical protein
VSNLAWHSPADLLGELAPAISAGTFQTGEKAHPLYQLIALSDGRAWIRDVRSGTDHILPKARRKNS